MFRVNERREAAGLLRVGDDVQHQRGFAGRFRAVNFHDAAARNAADTKCKVNRQAAGRYDVNFHQRPRIAEAHDRAVAVCLGDGRDGGFEFALPRGGGFGLDDRFLHGLLGFGGHKIQGLFFDLTDRKVNKLTGLSQTPMSVASVLIWIISS